MILRDRSLEPGRVSGLETEKERERAATACLPRLPHAFSRPRSVASWAIRHLLNGAARQIVRSLAPQAVFHHSVPAAGASIPLSRRRRLPAREALARLGSEDTEARETLESAGVCLIQRRRPRGCSCVNGSVSREAKRAGARPSTREHVHARAGFCTAHRV